VICRTAIVMSVFRWLVMKGVEGLKMSATLGGDPHDKDGGFGHAVERWLHHSEPKEDTPAT
jgi:hypothetical protein